jgi:hypothetical protein
MTSPSTQQVETTAGPQGERRTLVVQNIRDERGWLRRELHAEEDGSLVIEGQDLGSGVSDFWGEGMGEYEFTRTVSPAAVAELRLSLGIGDDLSLRRWVPGSQPLAHSRNTLKRRESRRRSGTG